MTNMTRQEALGVLHQVYNAYVDLLIESSEAFHTSEPLRLRAVQALFVLTDAIHGSRQPGELYTLCDSCHVRRAWREVGYRNTCHACSSHAPTIPLTSSCSTALAFQHAELTRSQRNSRDALEGKNHDHH